MATGCATKISDRRSGMEDENDAAAAATTTATASLMEPFLTRWISAIDTGTGKTSQCQQP